ncbi:MAG: hypothetical protein E7C49_14220 [Clostridium sp.]|nr:hypothetical protein [Clostridium sp.]
MGILKFIHPDNVYRQDYLDREDGMINSYDYCRFNNDSAVILVNYNQLQMLLTADIERETELYIINMGLIDMNSIDVLKVGHHAFEGSATKEFIEYVRTDVEIITREGYSYNNDLEILSLIKL